MAGIPFDAPLNMNNNKINNLAPGVLATDAATVSQLGASGVTSVSVTSANGFAGTVATPTTTPAISVQTSVTGLLKGNGTAVSAAVSNTDYLAPQPWQFFPENYGAKGNGKVIGDAVIGAGSLSTLTSNSAAFTSADTGKFIIINGAGTGGNNNPPLITTITFVSATVVTLAAPASGAVTNASAIYGTDDTAAINSAVSAAHTYALANNYFAQVMFRSVNYCLASGPTQTGDGSTTPRQNSQIPLPYPNVNGTTQKEVIEFVNIGGNSAPPMYWISTVPNLSGTCLVSMVLAPASGGSATFGAQSVIGGPTSNGSLTGGFANIRPVLSGITIVTPFLSQQMAADFRYTGGYRVRNGYSALAFAAPQAGAYNNMNALTGIGTFTGGNSIGLYAPFFANNDDCAADSITTEGFTFGVAFSEHFSVQTLTTIYSNVDGFVQVPAVAIHGASIGHWSCEASNIVLQSGASSGGQFPVFIGLMDAEVINTWHVLDTNNSLTGVVNWAQFNISAPLVSGASNLKIINARLGPGSWASPPAVPANNVAQQNTSWRDATVYLTSGGAAVSAIKVDAVTTGLSLSTSGSVMVRVPAGHSITLTYASTAPTWVWVLD